MEKSENKWRVTASKISDFADARLDVLCKKKGLTRYELIQMIVDTLIRYMDDQHNLSYEMEQAMSIFEHLAGWKEAFNLADYTTEWEVQDAIYFIGNPKKKGIRACFVSKPFMGLWTQNFNVQQIVEQFLNYISPERYKRMRQIAFDEGCSSLLEFFDRIIDIFSSNADLKSLRQPFEDNDRSDYGRKPADAPYVRKHHKDIETFDKQTTIQFED